MVPVTPELVAVELATELDELITTTGVELAVMDDDSTTSAADVDFTTDAEEDFTTTKVEDATTATAREVELFTTVELEDLTTAFVVETGTETEEEVLVTAFAEATLDALATPLLSGLQNTAGV
jgi:hypothetical protein